VWATLMDYPFQVAQIGDVEVRAQLVRMLDTLALTMGARLQQV